LQQTGIREAISSTHGFPGSVIQVKLGQQGVNKPEISANSYFWKKKWGNIERCRESISLETVGADKE